MVYCGPLALDPVEPVVPIDPLELMALPDPELDLAR
jgi:hypothetical protein